MLILRTMRTSGLVVGLLLGSALAALGCNGSTDTGSLPEADTAKAPPNATCDCNSARSGAPDASPDVADSAVDPGIFPATTEKVTLRASIDSLVREEGATDCGPVDLNGISFDDETYTLDLPTRELSWRVCERHLDGGAPAPFPPLAGDWAYRTGTKVLSDAELANVDAALQAVHVTTPTGPRIADVPLMTVTVTTPDATTTYDDDLTAGGPVAGVTFVHGLGGVFSAVATYAR